MFRLLVIILALCAIVGLTVHLVFVAIDHAINQAVASSFEDIAELDNR